MTDPTSPTGQPQRLYGITDPGEHWDHMAPKNPPVVPPTGPREGQVVPCPKCGGLAACWCEQNPPEAGPREGAPPEPTDEALQEEYRRAVVAYTDSRWGSPGWQNSKAEELREVSEALRVRFAHLRQAIAAQDAACDELAARIKKAEQEAAEFVTDVENAWEVAESRRELLMSEPKCACCGKPAVCFGAYDNELRDKYACGECCAHGNEDGYCAFLFDHGAAERQRLASQAGNEIRKLLDVATGYDETSPTSEAESAECRKAEIEILAAFAAVTQRRERDRQDIEMAENYLGGRGIIRLTGKEDYPRYTLSEMIMQLEDKVRVEATEAQSAEVARLRTALAEAERQAQCDHRYRLNDLSKCVKCGISSQGFNLHAWDETP